MKRVVFMLLMAAACLALGCAQATYMSSMYHEVGDWGGQFKIYGEGGMSTYVYTLSITKYLGSDTDVTVPASLTWQGKEYQTTEVGAAFPNADYNIGWVSNNTTLERVTIPEGVVSISTCFEQCVALREVNLPSSLRELGGSTFRGCAALEHITLPNGLQTIGNGVFVGCTSLREINVPEGVTSVGTYCFKDNTSLISAHLPTTLTTLGKSAFQNCTSLQNVNLPNGLTLLQYGTFEKCTSLESITVPGSVAEIEWNAFLDCRGLTSVTLEEGVRVIGTQAFWDCDALPTIHLPASVSAFSSTGSGGYNPFRCKSMTSITVAAGNAFFKSVDGVLYSADGLSLLCLPGAYPAETYVIPDGVKVIALAGCGAYPGIVDVPDSVDEIGRQAFSVNSTLIVGEDSYALTYAKKNWLDYIIRSSGEPTLSGDANGDGQVDLQDLIAIIRYINNPARAIDFANANLVEDGSGDVDFVDLVSLLNMLCQ